MSTSCSRRLFSLALTLALTFSLVTVSWPRPLRAGDRVAVVPEKVPTQTNAETEERAREAYGKLGVSFEENRGQADERVRFLARHGGATVYLTNEEAAFVLSTGGARGRASGERPVGEKRSPEALARRDQPPERPKMYAVRMKFEGANPAAEVTGERELQGRVNYFRGSDPSKWRANVKTYGAVRYRGLYEGIDLIYYGNEQGEMEYDFVVAPGADPRRISLLIEGAEDLKVDTAGDLVINTPAGEMRQRRPLVYQEVGGARREVKSGYAVQPGGRVRFNLGEYDTSAPLIIDPALQYSTYLGGSDGDVGNGIAVDSAGNAYVTGSTYSTNFPTPDALQSNSAGKSDVFVTKFNAAGTTLVYSTYLGGNDSDEGHGIALDASGNAYVTGNTRSTNFPTANALQGAMGGGSDAFVLKLNAAGSALVYSTYLGGSTLDVGHGVAVDSAGSAYVAGYTYSTDFPVANPIQGASPRQDAFVLKLNAAGSALIYSTHLGGNYLDEGHDIAVDSAGSAYVAGYTASTDFPVVNAYQSTLHGDSFHGDAFVTKLNADGSAFVYSTYLGGGDWDVGFGIAVDSAGHAYVVGRAYSTDFPTANALQGASGGFGDAFVTKLNVAGSALVYSTYLGGHNGERATAVAVDAAGNAYVTGYTESSDFPLADAVQSRYAGVFVTKLNADGSAFIYSTFLGGENTDVGNGIAVDSAGSVYVTGLTYSFTFPTPFGFQRRKAGWIDSFVAKIAALPFIQGRVIAKTGAGEAGVPWVTVKLTGTQTMTKLTDARGYYSFSALTEGGHYTVTPSKGDLFFVPASKNFPALNESVSDVNFATPSLFVADIGLTEGNSGEVAATFTVRLQPARSEPVTVKYRTAPGATNPAAGGADYTPLPPTQLTFAPGETEKTVSVTVKGDVLDEPHESFRLLLSEPVNALLPDPDAVCTVTDDDARPSLSVNRVFVTEGDADTTAVFAVTLSAPSGWTVKVKYQTADGTATAPADYTAQALTTLTFAPGETTRKVVVTVKGDTLDEPSEYFVLRLSSAVNANFATATGKCTITDDD